MRISGVAQEYLNKLGMGKPNDKKMLRLNSQVIVANQLGKLDMNDDFIAFRNHVLGEIKADETKLLLHHENSEIREDARIRLQVFDRIETKMKIKIGDGEKASKILIRFKEEQ